MHGRPCPHCYAEPPRFLEGASRDAMVLYYLCRHCGHTWNVPKNDPDGPIEGVTVDQPKT